MVGHFVSTQACGLEEASTLTRCLVSLRHQGPQQHSNIAILMALCHSSMHHSVCLPKSLILYLQARRIRRHHSLTDIVIRCWLETTSHHSLSNIVIRCWLETTSQPSRFCPTESLKCKICPLGPSTENMQPQRLRTLVRAVRILTSV